MAKHLRGINLLGLDGFGNYGPVLGVAVGGGGALATSWLVGKVTNDPTWVNNSELIGFLAGVGVSAGLMTMPSTRTAGMVGIASAAVATGFRWVVSYLSKGSGTAGMGVAVVDQLGMPSINYLTGLGQASVGPQPRAYGTIPGVAGLGGTAGVAQASHLPPPVNLLAGGSPQSAQAQMMGAPVSHGLASRYGANLFGGLG